ncbi:MAG: hypothetical protein HYY55_03240 [Candidatus Niyogibacteria bacterium]|nr:MAG: hypothetical protein HYY55_03240 [Candidatus Niyogibacteria bacterium]
MAIKFGNKKFEFFASSGSLGFDGLGWPWEKCLPKKYFDPSLFCVVLKTITPDERQGNGRIPWFKVRPIYENGELVGFVNCLGLPNPGFLGWKTKYLAKIDFNRDVVFSIASYGVELSSITREFNSLPLTAVELNASCPNTEEEMTENAESTIDSCRRLYENCRHPIILKLSYAQNFCRIAREAERYVAAISFNTVPWNLIFPDGSGYFKKYGGGGVSGKIVRWFYEDMAKKLMNYCNTPIIVPVWDYEDIIKNEEIGASAHSFGSVFIAYPWFPTLAVKHRQKEKKWNRLV